MLTGCRRNETSPCDGARRSRRGHDPHRRRENGRPHHSPPTSAFGVLKTLPRKPGDRWVIPGASQGTHMTDIDGAWQSIRARAELHDVRIHDIRHSFTSPALPLGEGLPIINRLPRSPTAGDHHPLCTPRTPPSETSPRGSPQPSTPTPCRRYNSAGARLWAPAGP